MLRYGMLSTPLPSSSSLQLRNNHNYPRNLTISYSSTHDSPSSSSSAATPAIPPITYTMSDKELKSRGLFIHRTFTDLNLDQLNSVFVAVGFPRRDPEKIRVALENTDTLLWVENQKNGRPVAFARATGDGVFNAIIWDVVVDPTYQGIGLGKAVMERLLEALVCKGITNIALYSEPRVLGFYRPIGFVADPDGIRGMVYSRNQNKKKRW